MKSKVLIAVFVFLQLASRAFAQFGGGIVFDPTQSGHAIEQIQQAQQLYTTALQTRDTVITNGAASTTILIAIARNSRAGAVECAV